MMESMIEVRMSKVLLSKGIGTGERERGLRRGFAAVLNAAEPVCGIISHGLSSPEGRSAVVVSSCVKSWQRHDFIF